MTTPKKLKIKRRLDGLRMARVEVAMRTNSYKWPESVNFRGRWNEDGSYEPNKSELCRALGFQEDHRDLIAYRETPEYENFLVHATVEHQIEVNLKDAEDADVNRAVLRLISRELLLRLTLYAEDLATVDLLRYLPTYQRLVGPSVVPLKLPVGGDIYGDALPSETANRLALVAESVDAG